MNPVRHRLTAPLATLCILSATTGLGLSCSHRGSVLVGGACSSDEACTTNVCIREVMSATAWSGGYCSGSCGIDLYCPQGRCLTFANKQSYCVAECAADGECRKGYVCSPEVGACLPDCRLGWSCGDTLVCDGATGACTVPLSLAGTAPLGTACAYNPECASGLCIPERDEAGSVAWTDGLCSKECGASANCPAGSTCVSLEDGSAYCVPACTGTADCRAGYVCSTGVGGCLPDCRLGWSCGSSLICDAATGACTLPTVSPGTTPFGAACTLSEECETGLCIPEHGATGSVSWSGGTCSLECANASCPAAAVCATLEDGSAYCVPTCAAGGDCRAGYVCAASIAGCLPDCRLGWDCGTSLVCDAATGACTPAAGNAPLGSGCTYNVECASGLCIPESGDAGSVSWSGGTCSLECSNASCPAGATCMELVDGSAYCVPDCAGPADCRTGYVCSAEVGACLPDCRLGWGCGDHLTCDAATGTCVPPAGNAPLGSACAYNVECASGLCIPESGEAGNLAWSGGTCSLECSNASCPAGATCMELEDGRAYCVPTCASSGDCRTGYVCSAEVGGCLPDCRLGWSCGSSFTCDAATGTCVPPAGNAPLGSACVYNRDCASGLCIPQHDDAGAVSWSGGTCSQECTTTAACPAESICVALADGRAYCVPDCTSPADCRTGYVCSTGVGACLPDCRLGWDCGSNLVCDAATGACTQPAPTTVDAPLGASCTLNAECASGLCIPERGSTGTLAWSDGTCSQECSVAACPAGAVCVAMEDGSAYCVSACASAADCRTGYVCDLEVSGCLPDCRLGWSCGTYLVCDAVTGTCEVPTLADGGVPDAGYADGAYADSSQTDAGVTDAVSHGPGDTGGPGPGGNDAGRGGGTGPGGMLADRTLLGL